MAWLSITFEVAGRPRRGAVRRLARGRRGERGRDGRRCRLRRRAAGVRRTGSGAAAALAAQPRERAGRAGRRRRGASLPPRAPAPASRRRRCRVSEVAEQDWVRASRDQFAPIRISPRLWIVPSWHRAARPGRDQHLARSGPGLRHRQSSDHAAVPALARARGARRGNGARLRLRFRHTRHRGDEARGGARGWRGYRRAGAACGARTMPFTIRCR